MESVFLIIILLAFSLIYIDLHILLSLQAPVYIYGTSASPGHRININGLEIEADGAVQTLSAFTAFFLAFNLRHNASQEATVEVLEGLVCIQKCSNPSNAQGTSSECWTSFRIYMYISKYMLRNTCIIVVPSDSILISFNVFQNGISFNDG